VGPLGTKSVEVLPQVAVSVTVPQVKGHASKQIVVTRQSEDGAWEPVRGSESAELSQFSFASRYYGPFEIRTAPNLSGSSYPKWAEDSIRNLLAQGIIANDVQAESAIGWNQPVTFGELNS